MKLNEALAIAEPIAKDLFTFYGSKGRVVATRLQYMGQRDEPLGFGWCQAAVAGLIAGKLIQYDRLIRPARKAKAQKAKRRSRAGGSR